MGTGMKTYAKEEWMVTRNLSWILTWDPCFPPALTPLSAWTFPDGKRTFVFLFEKLDFSAYSWEEKTLIATCGMGSHFLFYYLLFWSPSSETIRENQSSGTFLLDKGLCSCSLERSKTSLHGWIQQALLERHGICRHPVTAKMCRISACIYSKLGNRAASNTNQSRCIEPRRS